MKVRLLKKLRKEAHDRYRVVYNGLNYKVQWLSLGEWTVLSTNDIFDNKQDAINKCNERRKHEFYSLFYSYERTIY